MRTRHFRNTIIYIAVVAIATLSHFSLFAQNSAEEPRTWMHQACIGAYSLTPNNADEIVSKARSSWVHGIEVDNDVPSRYETLLDPSTKLHAIQNVAKSAHQAGNRAYVYVAGWSASALLGMGSIPWQRSIPIGCNATCLSTLPYSPPGLHFGSTPANCSNGLLQGFAR
jgi:hypothetical protein